MTDLYGYVAFYKGKTIEVYADTIYHAQLIASKQFKAKKPYDVTVVVCEEPDGSPIIHTPTN
jgi:hypothetical protein